MWLNRQNFGGMRELTQIRVILPKRNFKDVQADLPESTRKQMGFAYVGTIEEALEEVWGRDVWAVKGGARVEARL
jgi:ATP-dependent Lon protease